MGVYISVISKNNTSVKKLILSKMNNRELESSLNTEFDIKNTYLSANENVCVINFATDCIIYQAEQSFFYGKDGGYAAIQGDILPRHTEFSNDDFYKASDVYNYLSVGNYTAFKQSTSGTYSLIYVNGNGDVLSFNDSLGFEHIYYAETSDHIFISNRIRLIRCFIDNAEVDLHTLSSIVLMGSVLGNGTSIREIKRLPQGSFISVKNGKLDIHSDPVFYYDDQEVSDACAADFIGFVKKELTVCANRMAAVLRHKDDFSFALSGGKDSRALLAILMSIKDAKDISVFTNGYENHPDVAAAKLITEHYGIHHTINTPKPPSELTVDALMQKMMGSVFQTDGMIGLFNAKGNKDCNLDDIAFPGHINEVFRQFTKSSVKLDTLDDVITYYKKIHLYDPLNIMTDELHDHFDRQFTERAVSLDNAGLSLNDNNDTYFLGERLPNWSAYLLRQDGYAQNQFQILNNDKLIKAFFRKGCSQLRKMELLHFIMIKEFADNWLIETPFAVQQWDPSLEKFAYGVNISNPGIPLPENMPLHGTWQHKLNSSAELKVRLMEIFLSYPDSDIWKLYNKDKVLKSFLSQKLSYTPMISLYGFINMFFYNHNIEIPMRLKSDRRRTRTENVIVRDIDGSGIYRYDNDKITPFKSYDELTRQGYSGMYRIPVSAYAITTMQENDNKKGEIE